MIMAILNTFCALALFRYSQACAAAYKVMTLDIISFRVCGICYIIYYFIFRPDEKSLKP